MQTNKFKFPIYSDRVYSITVDDYEGKPYTFEVSGETIAEALRREALLTREWELTLDKEEDSGTI